MVRRSCWDLTYAIGCVDEDDDVWVFIKDPIKDTFSILKVDEQNQVWDATADNLQEADEWIVIEDAIREHPIIDKE